MGPLQEKVQLFIFQRKQVYHIIVDKAARSVTCRRSMFIQCFSLKMIICSWKSMAVKTH